MPIVALDFSLKADPSKLDDGTGYARSLFSRSLLWFYLGLDLTVFVVWPAYHDDIAHTFCIAMAIQST